MECGPFNAFDDRALCPSWSLHHRSDSKGQCYLCLRVQDQGTSLAGQWLRLHLLMQGVQVREIRSHMPRGQKNRRYMKNFKNFNDMHTHITKTYQLRAVRMAIRKNAAKNKW